MKKIEQITIKAEDGSVMREAISGDKVGRQLTASNMIIICFEQTAFTTSGEQWEAYQIAKKLEALEEGVKEFELEDAEFNLVKSKIDQFKPYQTGFTFFPLVELFK